MELHSISKLKCLGYLFAVISFLIESDFSWAKTRTCMGEAYHLKNQKLLYTVTSTFIFEKERHVETKVEYKNTQGNLIAEETRSYRKHRTVPDVNLIDHRNSYKEGAELINRKINLFNQRQSKGKKQQRITLSEPMVISAGIENLIKQHWDQLMNGDSLVFKYLLPGKLKYFSLTVKKVPRKSDNNKNNIRFKISLRNFFLGTLIKPIYLTFDSENRNLKIYEGYSNILDGKGKRFRVRTIFSDNCF